MEQTKSIFEINMDVVTSNLYNAVISLSNGRKFSPVMGVKRIYFAGATLCMDYQGDVLTLSHSHEDLGYFSGGIRRLLSIKNMQLFEALMDLCGVYHEQKWVTKRVVNS